MKKNLLFFALLFWTFSFAQIPAGYYNTATGTGYTLKTQLYNIIKGHTDNGYAGLYTTYLTSDIDNFYENDATILDMYSENPSGTDPYNYSSGSTQRCGNYSVEGDCYNREHIIPQSTFGSAAPMVSDAHFITPTDGKVNGIRSNYPHGTVATATWTSLNGSKLGSSSVSGYTGTVFEPINEFKGDIARMYLYFATRYETTISGYSYPMFNGTNNQVFTTAFLNMLLAWHAQDPVNAREIARNNAIYARQNNRNPFIDHPEYVQAIWNPTADTQAPTAATNLAVTGTTSSTISLSWMAATDNVAVTSYEIYMNGTLKTSVSSSNLTTTITGLSASTTYSFYVIAKDAAVNPSPASNLVNGTTTITIPDSQNPTAPTNLAVTGSSSSTVSLSWTASTDNIGVTSYDVYVNSAFKTSVSGTTAIANGLTPTTTYSFYVVAKDATGNPSLQSNSVNGTTTVISTSCANESFENIPADASSYATRTWTGDSGLNWTAIDARTDQTINTRAILVRNGSLSASTSVDGIGSLTITTQQKFTGTSGGTFNLRVNGAIVGAIPYSATGVSTTTTISGINISGDVIISFTDNSTTTNRVAFDNLSWTCYFGSVTWDGSAWSNITGPDADTEAIIAGTYTTTPTGTFTAKKLTVNSGKSLTINSGTNLTVQNEVINNGTFVIENNANLIQVNNTMNTGNITVKRNSNALSRLDYTMWSSSVTGSQTLTNFSPLTVATRFYTYDNTLGTNGLYVEVPSPSTTPFAIGTGYLIRMPNTAVTYPSTETFTGIFTGVPNNGPVGFSGLTAGKYYAVGNPYPSTVSATAFLAGNPTMAGTLYFWRKTNNINQGTSPTTSYASWTTAGGVANSGGGSAIAPIAFLQVGQGFIVNTGTSTTLNFDNTMRAINNSNVILKSKKVIENNRVWLNLTNASGAFSQTLVAYMDGATQEIDNGIDGKYINDSPIALTSNINNEEYSIQGRALPFDPSDVVALNFKTDLAGDYTIAIDHVDGLFAIGQDVYLIDSKTGTETNLKEGSYTFNATAGVDNARFSLKYQKTLKVNAPVFNENSIVVYKNKGTLFVNSAAKTIQAVQVYDIQGRLIAEQKNVKANATSIKNIKATNQVLIVKISDENNNVVAKKVLN